MGLEICARETPEGSSITMSIETLSQPAMSGSWAGGPRHLLIISRYHPGLYDYVRARFANEVHVEVILDRRRSRDRRTSARGSQVERRSGDRRSRPHVDAALRMESMQFVTIAAAPTRAEPTVDDDVTIDGCL
jgi:hypothetical protein